MTKLAIFVEGQTEQAFLEKLCEAIAGVGNLQIVLKKAYGGAKCPRRFVEIRADSPQNSNTQFHVMIVDSSGDNSVKSDVRDQYDSLTREGYTAIIGIRDVFPDFARSDINALRRGLTTYIKTKPIEVKFVLGVMEIEAWFLAEDTHFSRIDPSLTPAAVFNALGFAPGQVDTQLRDHPADDLHKIYSLVGLAYRKHRNQVERTVNALDYTRIYMDWANKFPDLADLFAALDAFFTPTPSATVAPNP
jgi:hypothetical protein